MSMASKIVGLRTRLAAWLEFWLGSLDDGYDEYSEDWGEDGQEELD